MGQRERVSEDLAKMQMALEQAHIAQKAGEVPVGAALFLGDELICKAHNAPVCTHNPCGHAEVLVLQEAGRRLGNYRLEGCSLFVTLEPCVMCAGAILNARIKTLVFGAKDERAGAAGSVLNVFENPRLNTHTQVRAGVLAEDCAKPLVDFFKLRRSQIKAKRDHTKLYLREDAFRPDLHQFKQLMLPWMQKGLVSNYTNDLACDPGLRIHHWDTQEHGADVAPTAQAPQPRKTWVCLHGLGSSGAFFSPWAIERACLGERVLMPDLIGFGLSDHLRSATHIDLQHQVLLLQEWFDRMRLDPVHLLSHDWSAQLALALVPRLGSEVKSWVCLNPNLNLSSFVHTRQHARITWQACAALLSQSKAGMKDLHRLHPHLSVEQMVFLASQLPKQTMAERLSSFDQWVLKPSVSSPLGLSVREATFWSSPHAPSVWMACTKSLPWSGEGQEELRLLGQHLKGARVLAHSPLGEFGDAEVFTVLSQRVSALI